MQKAAASVSSGDPTTEYARAVVAGGEVVGRLVRLACERHLRDLESGTERGLRWDAHAAAHALTFFAWLRLETPAGPAPFEPRPFQQFIVGSLFGWKKTSGFRRFRTAYIEQGKGNGKTPLASAVGLYCLMADGEPEPEVYCAAVTREQASIAFRDARNMVERSPALAARLDVGQHNIAYLQRAGFMRPLSSEHRGLDGKRVHCAIVDEIHEHPSALVVDKISAGTKARRQALILEITNSGYDRTSVCYQHHQYSRSVLEGTTENDDWFAYVCSLDPCERHRAEGHLQPADGCSDCDNWLDERVWPKVNPGLDSVLPRDYLRTQVRQARGMPTQEGIVRRLNFCHWTQAATRAIPADLWIACGIASKTEHEGRECYAGLDIGATSDFTAYVRLFPHDDEEIASAPPDPRRPDEPPRRFMRRSYTLVPHFWLPEDPRRRDARTQAAIDAWARQGLITLTPGNVVDYDWVLDDVLRMDSAEPVRVLGFDRGFQGTWLGSRLLDALGEGRVVAFPQGLLSMAAPFREFLELIKAKRFRHTNHPVMSWMVSNCAAEERGGLSKPSKDHSAEKIDGVTAAVMALGVAMAGAESEASWYEPGMLGGR